MKNITFSSYRKILYLLGAAIAFFFIGFIFVSNLNNNRITTLDDNQNEQEMQIGEAPVHAESSTVSDEPIYEDSEGYSEDEAVIRLTNERSIPYRLIVLSGANVIWENNADSSCKLTIQDAQGNTVINEDIVQSGEYSYVFESIGEYLYKCLNNSVEGQIGVY